MLEFRNYSKNYNGTLVISIPGLKLNSGIYWIRGENGSGKSTLFKSLAGLLPYDGTIILSGSIDLWKHPLEFRRRVNFSEAEPLFPGFLTAKDLIGFVGSARSADVRQQTEIAAKFGIDKFIDKRCETYSSGMLKKLSLALAFLGKPDIVILDEPLITLDEAARNVLLELIRDLKDVVVLVSSHQLFEIDDLEIKGKFRIVNKTLINE